MFLLVTLFVATVAYAQSLVPVPFSDSAFHTNTCLRRSVFVYTSESATYVVTNIGTTSFAANPTYCANASVSTSYVYGDNQTVTTALPASTIKIYQQQTLPATTALPASTITIYQQQTLPVTTALPASTITVYQQQTLPAAPTSSAVQPAETVLADAGFEDGNENPFNATSSGSGVSAAVAQSGPLLPYSGDSYL